MICLLILFVFLLLIGSLLTFYTHYIKRNELRKCGSGSSDFEKLLVYSEINECIETESNAFSSIARHFEKCNSFFNCFCPFTNGAKIMDTSNRGGHLRCLDGIRCLNMFWIILCHNYVFSFTSVRNPADTLNYMDKWFGQIILNGFFAVDSFFLLSGFLMARLFFQKCAEIKISWTEFYIHRYMRITPVYMAVVGFYTTLYGHLTSGPMWIYADTDPKCQSSWWYNILYINNFQTMNEQCMGWSWYLANDMQFYVISPLLLIPLRRWPKIGYALIAAFFCIVFGSNFYITYEYNLYSGLGNIVEQTANIHNFLPRWIQFFDMLYIKPYTRMGSYLVGIVLAYYTIKREQKSRDKLRPIVLTIGWIVSSVLSLSCIFGLYHRHLTIVEGAFYNALSRTVFSCCQAWIIFVCIIGQGGIVNSILSWKIWMPLSRLTFCAYLVHPIVETAYYSSMRSMFEFSHFSMIILSCGFLILSYAAAFVVSLLFESPVIRLEKLIRNKFRS